MSAEVIAFPQHRREPEPLLTLAQLAEHCQRSERWLRYRLAEGMPSQKWGGGHRFRFSDVEAWMGERYAS